MTSIVSKNTSDVVFFSFDSLLLRAQLSFVLVEIDNSTLCLPLLYSATIHSTPSKAQKYISDVFKDNSVVEWLFSNIFMSYKKFLN